MADYTKFSRRGLLLHIAEQNDVTHSRLETIMALTEAEQAAINNVSTALTTLGGDVSILKDDVVAVFQAKDNLIHQLRQDLSTAMAADAADVATIANKDTEIAQLQTSAADAANTVVSNLSGFADAIANIDTNIGSTKSSVDAEVETPTTPPTDTTPPPVDTAPPAPDTTPSGDVPSP